MQRERTLRTPVLGELIERFQEREPARARSIEMLSRGHAGWGALLRDVRPVGSVRRCSSAPARTSRAPGARIV